MKKILKNRIFIIIMLCIISCGIGVYGANAYLAKNITYRSSDESEDIEDVEAALNDLYSSIKKCSANEFCSNAKLGDYVSMTPTSTTYTILKSLTGYSKDQTIEPSELTLWRIISINNDGTIEMVSENVSGTGVHFKGKTGYLNLVGVLNDIASQYGNSKYTKSARIMGYNGQTSIITDASKFTKTAPWDSSTSDNSNESLGGGDVMYEEDTNLVKDILGTLIATTPSGTATSYWLGSRHYNYSSSTSYSWAGRCVDIGIDHPNKLHSYVNVNIIGNQSYYSMIDYDHLYYYDSSLSSNDSSNSIRPILTLKSGLTATGSGTSTDPWVLQ